MELLALIGLLTGFLLVAIVIVVFVVLVQHDFERVIEQVVFFARLGDPRASLQVASFVYFVGYSSVDETLAERNDRAPGDQIELVAIVTERAQRDLDIPVDEVCRDAWLELHQVSFEHNVVFAGSEEIFTGD